MRKKLNLKLLATLLLLCITHWSFGQKDLDLMRQLIFEKTNELRASAGLKALKPLDSLMELAQYHSVNMVEERFYAHVDHEGLTPVERAEKKGVQPWVKRGNSFYGIAENIAQTPWFENVIGCGDTRSNSTLADCMVLGWKNSPPHYKNIMGDYTYLGVGLFFDESGMGYGTQNFR